MPKEIRRIAVIGGGTMGGGIAALCARQGVRVKVLEFDAVSRERAMMNIRARFDKWLALGKITNARCGNLKEAVSVTWHPEHIASFCPDLIIEAIIEDEKTKVELFRKLDGIIELDTLLASNTSTIPITDLAAETGRPDRFIGMHFFNPPTSMPLVEIIPGGSTGEETVESVTAFARDVLGKTTIRVADRPGFLVNRLLLPYLTEAVLFLQEHCGFNVADVDKEATDLGWPMGPFKLLDTIGIDVAYNACKIVAASEPGAVVPDLLERMHASGRWGDKAASGFYGTGRDEEPLEDMLNAWFPARKPVFHTVSGAYHHRIMVAFLREAVNALQDGVASAEDIETGATLGLGCPGGGPLHIIDAHGIPWLTNFLEGQDYRGGRFSVPQLLRKMEANGESFFSSW